MRTAVIILNFNTANLVEDCIESIRMHFKSDYGIIIVDNASKAENRQLLNDFCAGDESLELLLLDDNLGFSGGNNAGIKKAIADGYDAALVMNSDIIVDNDILSIMEKDLSDEVAWVGPKVYDIEGMDGQHIRKNYSFGTAFWAKRPLYSLGIKLGLTADMKSPSEKYIFQGSVSGCCFLFDCHVLDKIGMLDDNVFLYCEEYIMGKKLEQLGLNTCYDPAASVNHLEGKSTKKISNAFIDYHLYASEYYLLVRYCSLKGVKRAVIRTMRLFNFALKAMKNESYKERYQMLKNKFKEIEQGNYKITF